MKKALQYMFFAFSFSLIIACEKDVEPTNTLAKSELEKNNYIKAFVNNEEVNLTGKLPLGDIFFNSYIASERNLRLQRVDTANPTVTFDLIIENLNYSAMVVPTTYTYADDSLNMPSLAVFFYDSTGTTFSNNILRPNSFQLTVQSKEQDVMIGSFEGTLYSQNQDSLKVENGLYRIKIKKYD